MADLMEDANNFSWQRVKAAHAVLCCELETGAVTWEETLRIDRSMSVTLKTGPKLLTVISHGFVSFFSNWFMPSQQGPSSLWQTPQAYMGILSTAR